MSVPARMATTPPLVGTDFMANKPNRPYKPDIRKK